MTPSFSIIVGTFGDQDFWGGVAAARAIPSAENQTLPAEVIYSHSSTIAEARNLGAKQAAGSHLIFLDADDALDPYYVEGMWDRLRDEPEPPFQLIRPATFGIRADGVEDDHEIVLPPKPILEGNFMVIGTLIASELFEKVGGFNEWPLYEDWELWIRCWRAGAVFTASPDSIYHVHVRDDSRNNQPRPVQLKAYRDIQRLHQRARRRSAR